MNYSKEFNDKVRAILEYIKCPYDLTCLDINHTGEEKILFQFLKAIEYNFIDYDFAFAWMQETDPEIEWEDKRELLALHNKDYFFATSETQGSGRTAPLPGFVVPYKETTRLLLPTKKLINELTDAIF